VLGWAQEGRPFAIVERAASLGHDDLEVAAEAYLHKAVSQVSAGDPPIKIIERLVFDHPVEALVEESEFASMLVVGARGVGVLRRVLVGSISSGCALRADAPVVVVRGEPVAATDTRPVLVGVDGSPASLVALRWAAGEAKLRGVPLRVVHAWTIPVGMLSGYYAIPIDAVKEAAQNVLDEAAEAAVEPSGGVPVLRELANGNASAALLTMAAETQLLVVGARGHGGFTGLALGSTSHQCVVHAPCPTAVIREPVKHQPVI
jgi:nucleotide-binding universal stress UspA family protein